MGIVKRWFGFFLFFSWFFLAFCFFLFVIDRMNFFFFVFMESIEGILVDNNIGQKPPVFQNSFIRSDRSTALEKHFNFK